MPRPPHPITHETAALFLHYETNRSKKTRDGKNIPNTRVGRSSIQQTISALQNYRVDHQRDDVYRSSPDVHIPLRDNVEIREIERGAKADEPERQKESQELKAQGVAHQTFTTDELVLMSDDHLSNPKGHSKLNVYSSLRDRSMLLSTTSMVVRGDTIRGVLLSDLLVRDVILPDIGLDHQVKALVIFSNQGKTNVDGHHDYHATLRHRNPKLCAVGGLAMFLFCEWQVLKAFERPNFTPDFSNSLAGPFGLREWYNIVLYHRHDDQMQQMSPENHRARVNAQKVALSLNHLKATHGGRGYGATNAINYGASQEDVRALGIWSQAGSFSIYNQTLPVNAMVASAGCNGNKQDSYFIARDTLDPPTELIQAVFPWIEAEKQAYHVRMSIHGPKAQDESMNCLLELLLWLRRVLIQDAALLYQEFPKASIFLFHPFNTSLFQDFSAASVQIIREAEDMTRHHIKAHEIEEKYALTFKGVMETVLMRLDERLQTIDLSNQQVLKHLSFGKGSLESASYQIQADTVTAGTTNLKRKASVSVPDKQDVMSSLHRHKAPRLILDLDEALPTASSSAPSLPTGFFYSRKGTIYPYATFPINRDRESVEYNTHLTAVDELEERFAPEKLKEYKFIWSRTKGVGEWIPDFVEKSFWTPARGDYPETVDQIWQEFTEGIDGRLSIEDLESHWGARWKQNKSSLKTEYSRRKKVVSLVRELAQRPGWDADIALQYLQTSWPINSSSSNPNLKSVRRFTDYLQSKVLKGYSDVIDAAADYVIGV